MQGSRGVAKVSLKPKIMVIDFSKGKLKRGLTSAVSPQKVQILER
jgi:hypothetical protein